MAQPNITFIKGQGGLGRPLAGEDYLSGMLFYCANAKLPSGFSTSKREATIYSLADAEALGIKNDYADATASTATYLITTAGATGDIIKIAVADVNNSGSAQTQTLCTYTKLASDSTIAILGASIATAINNGTQTHGYSASFTTATLTITAPKRLGILLNSGTPYTVTITGTIAGTLTQNVVVGIASDYLNYWYKISEFYRLNPKGVLYIGFYLTPTTYTFTEITTLNIYANGKIRQMIVTKALADSFTLADCTLIQSVCELEDNAHRPISNVLYDSKATALILSTLTDLSTFTNEKVSINLSQDGGGYGNMIYLTTGNSVSTNGALLGTISKAKVSESIAWVGSFDISNGLECEVLAFVNGVKYTAVSDSLLDTIHNSRYIFLKKFVGLSGSYFVDSSTMIAKTSDYAYIENNRTIDKAVRNLYSSYLPYLNSPLQLNANGTLSDNTVATLENVGDVALDQMLRDFEISAKQVTINPVQNVLSTSKLVVAVTLVINGVARDIEIPIGFKPSIA
jgi:hypothetical protein